VHPGDVARHIDESVDALRNAVDRLPASSIIGIEHHGVDLHVHYEADVSASTVGTAAPDLLIGHQLGGTMYNVPIIGSRRREQFILALDLTDFDSQPPTAELLSDDRTPLPRARWPRDPEGQGIVPNHRLWPHRPFFCRPGTREFHTHPQHEDEPWDAYREGMSLTGVVLPLVHDLTTRWTMQ